MTRESPSAVDWRSLATSRSTGKSFMAPSTRGAHTRARSDRHLRACSWNCVRLVTRVDLEILHRLQIDRDALRRAGGAQPGDDGIRIGLAHMPRLERDGEPADIERGVGAVGADERRHGLHVGVGANHIGRRALPVHHGGKRNRGRRLGDADEKAGILLRKEALGNDPPPARR
jgi:hypothetical protein